MAVERAQVEADLINLLEQAIDKIKRLRLDHVDEVSKIFEEAFQCLESNLITEETSFDAAGRLLGKAQISKQSRLSFGNHFVPKQGINKNMMLRNVTSDYTSPSLKKRSIISTSTNNIKSFSFRNANSRTQLNISDDSSDDDVPMPKSRISGTFSNHGARISGTFSNQSARISGTFSNHSALLKSRNKSISNNFTRDTSSPSLGGRSLGKKMPPAPGASSGLDLSLREKTNHHHHHHHRHHHHHHHNMKALSSRSALGLSNENDTENNVAVAPSSRTVNKEVDPYASPVIMAASRNLINMANPLDDRIQQKTPKAAFLRRLDSPESNHAKLMKARTDLTELINKCFELVPRMDIAKYDVIKNKFDIALKKLEQGQIVNRTPG